jgi:hypothetical protein
VKSENKAKWRKYLLTSLGGLVAAGVILFAGSLVAKVPEEHTATSPFPKSTAERPTDMMAIRLGETLANLQFERGKFEKPLTYEVTTPDGRRYKFTAPEKATEEEIIKYVKEHVPSIQQEASANLFGIKSIVGYYITDNNVIIHEKEGRAERLEYNCETPPTDPARYFHKIQCGNTASDVMQAYGQNNVTVLCSDTIVETRLYDITGKNIRLWLTKNAVQRIEFSTQPFPPSETFKKRCL